MRGRSSGIGRRRARVGRRLFETLRVAVMSTLIGACSAPTTTETAGASAPDATSVPDAVAPSAELVRVTRAISIGLRDDFAGEQGLLPADLQEGDMVWIIERAEVSGQAWYLVAANHAEGEFAMPFGWMPAMLEGRPTVEPSGLECPRIPLTVPAAAGLGTFGGLACYGDEPVQLVGFTPIACGIGSSPRVGVPDWLNGTWTIVGIGDVPPQPPDFTVGATVSARAAPGAPIDGQCGTPGWYRFLGHFDDPAAPTCRTEMHDAGGMIRTDPRLSQLLCRASLVLTDSMPINGPP